METLIDSLDFKPDNFKVIPVREWRIMMVGKAKVSHNIPRWCLPNCEFYRKDNDGGPLCYDECEHWIFDRHPAEIGDSMVNLLFAVNTEDPHEGFTTWVTENHLVNLLGRQAVNELIKEYNAMIKPPEEGIRIK